MSTFFLYKYLSIANPKDWKHRRKLLVDRELYFSDPRNFNDPLDCALADGSLAKNLLNPFKAFCMSTKSRDDALMFSHYGDSHRGFRLKFKVRNDQTIGESSPLELGQPVEYVNELPTFDSKNIHRMPYLKSMS